MTLGGSRQMPITAQVFGFSGLLLLLCAAPDLRVPDLGTHASLQFIACVALACSALAHFLRLGANVHSEARAMPNVRAPAVN